ncbi:ferritin-like domain-containing protein [Nonlabens antarcticus]|uniref:ferritin-like domain-containing protein n=1 Tax=Nonlabens antarcticus TaxID=392714 RepID=UPI001891E016|nr:PA2169 family four-helix-bundle protein [Nonlabens antarcticus]
MKFTDNIGNKLNEILEKNNDAVSGYKAAREQVSDKHLRDFFASQVVERKDFGEQLAADLKSMGEKPEAGTSIAGDTHRLWMNIKSTFSSNNDKSVLTEAIRGEKNAIEEYDEILDAENVPTSTKDIMKKHRNKIQNAINNMEGLELSSN